MTNSLEKVFSKKSKEIDEKIKNSFTLIRQDLSEMDQTVEAMRKYLKRKDKNYTYAKSQDNKLREEFRRNVDDFTIKITQLKIALSTVNSLKSEYIIRKDLAKIEDRIKTHFKYEIDRYKDKVESQKILIKDLESRLKKLEKEFPSIKKKSWFS